MADYTRQQDFTAKGALTPGDPLKVIKGEDVDSEFNAIVTAIESKVDEPASPNSGDLLAWDGSAVVWTARSALGKFGALAGATNLIIQAGATAATQVDIDADSVLLVNSSGEGLVVNNVNLTVTITTAGANGLDTGSESGSTWYHLWVIYNINSSTTAGLMSESATAPTLPSGYTYQGYVGAIYNDSSSDFEEIVQSGTLVGAQRQQIVQDTSGPTTYQSQSLAAYIPPTARTMLFEVRGDDDGSASWNAAVSPTNGDVGSVVLAHGAGELVRAQVELPILTSQQLYYKVNAATNNITIRLSGWRYS